MQLENYDSNDRRLYIDSRSLKCVVLRNNNKLGSWSIVCYAKGKEEYT